MSGINHNVELHYSADPQALFSAHNLKNKKKENPSDTTDDKIASVS